jgi:hypothetical protein
MDYSRTSPELLAKTVLSYFGKEVHYASVSTDGASKAAQIISEVLGGSSKS